MDQDINDNENGTGIKKRDGNSVNVIINILDDFSKHSYNILNESIIGYFKFFMLEVSFFKYLEDVDFINLDFDYNYHMDFIIYIIKYANCIREGKSFFSNKVAYYFYLIININKFMNDVPKLMNDIPELIKDSSRVEKDEVNVDEVKVGGQSGGVGPLWKLLKIAAVMLMTTLQTVATNQSTDEGESSDSEVLKSSSSSSYSKIPNINLEPNSIDSFNKFTALFGEEVISQTTTISTEKMSEIKPAMLKGIKSETSFTTIAQNYFTQKEYYDSAFQDAILEEVKSLNDVAKDTNKVLQEMCVSFTGKFIMDYNEKDGYVGSSLPIPTSVLFASEFAKGYQKHRSELHTKINDKVREIDNEMELVLEQLEKIPVKDENVEDKDSTLGLFKKYLFGRNEEELKKELVAFEKQHKTTQGEKEKIISTYQKKKNTEIAESTRKIEKDLTEIYSEEIMKTLKVNQDTARFNGVFRKYITSICKIKTPTYVYDINTNDLFILNHASTRPHLISLANNVIANYFTVIDGLYKLDVENKLIHDFPTQENLPIMQSCYEKSKYIIDILTEYNIGLSNTLIGDSTNIRTTEEAERYFKDIKSFWLELADKMKFSLQNFPETQKQSSEKISRKEENAKVLFKEKEQQNFEEKVAREQDIEHNRESNNLTAEELNEMRTKFRHYTKNVYGVGEDTVNGFVDATGNVGKNTLNNVNEVINTGIGSIVSLIITGSVATTVFLFFYTGSVNNIMTNNFRLNDNNDVIQPSRSLYQPDQPDQPQQQPISLRRGMFNPSTYDRSQETRQIIDLAQQFDGLTIRQYHQEPAREYREEYGDPWQGMHGGFKPKKNKNTRKKNKLLKKNKKTRRQ